MPYTPACLHAPHAVPCFHTQVSDVRPLLTVATYLDDQTGFEIYQEVGLLLHVFASSCSNYGQAGDDMIDETGAPISPTA